MIEWHEVGKVFLMEKEKDVLIFSFENNNNQYDYSLDIQVDQNGNYFSTSIWDGIPSKNYNITYEYSAIDMIKILNVIVHREREAIENHYGKPMNLNRLYIKRSQSYEHTEDRWKESENEVFGTLQFYEKVLNKKDGNWILEGLYILGCKEGLIEVYVNDDIEITHYEAKFLQDNEKEPFRQLWNQNKWRVESLIEQNKTRWLLQR